VSRNPETRMVPMKLSVKGENPIAGAGGESGRDEHPVSYEEECGAWLLIEGQKGGGYGKLTTMHGGGNTTRDASGINCCLTFVGIVTQGGKKGGSKGGIKSLIRRGAGGAHAGVRSS